MSAVADHVLPAPPGVRVSPPSTATPSPEPAAASAPLQAAPAARRTLPGWLACASWTALGALTLGLPNHEVGFADWVYTQEFGVLALAVAAALLLWQAWPSTHAWRRPVQQALPWLAASGAVLAIWELATAKSAWLPTPFFAPPTALAEVYLTDWARLGDSAVNSLKLLAIGVGIGGLWGFAVGVWIGWSRVANYWIHPVLRVLGPVPTTALLPICFFFFPSSWSTAVFLIALGTAFPVAILTWSGVVSVNKQYYDVARTLGASLAFLIFRVAIPAALPQVFVGLFMGLGAAFSTLVVAEMLGVKSGLGWYLTWAQGWAAYPNMYAALLLMALLFSGVITLLFTVRGRVLAWQKGVVTW